MAQRSSPIDPVLAEQVELLVHALGDLAAAGARTAAARALGALGPAVRERATRPLLRALRADTPPEVRVEAAAALRAIGAHGPDVARALARSLADDARPVRLHAALLLRALDPVELERAVPALAQLVGNLDDDVLDEVTRTLVHLGRARPDAVVAALSRRARTPRARASAARVLAELGHDPALAADEAFAWLEHPAPWLRVCAAVVIGRLALSPAERVRDVVAVLSRATDDVLEQALATWSVLGLDPLTIAAARTLEREGSVRARLVAVRVSGRLGPEDALALLVSLAARTAQPEVARAAVKALARADLPEAEAVAALLDALAAPATCGAAADALGERATRSSAVARRATPRVLNLTHDGVTAPVRSAAERCLARLRGARRQG